MQGRIAFVWLAQPSIGRTKRPIWGQEVSLRSAIYILMVLTPTDYQIFLLKKKTLGGRLVLMNQLNL